MAGRACRARRETCRRRARESAGGGLSRSSRRREGRGGPLRLWMGRGYAAVYVPVDGEPVLIVDLPDYRRDLVAVDDVRVGLDVPRTVGRALRERGAGAGRIGLAGGEIVSWESQRQLEEA